MRYKPLFLAASTLAAIWCGVSSAADEPNFWTTPKPAAGSRVLSDFGPGTPAAVRQSVREIGERNDSGLQNPLRAQC